MYTTYKGAVIRAVLGNTRRPSAATERLDEEISSAPAMLLLKIRALETFHFFEDYLFEFYISFVHDMFPFVRPFFHFFLLDRTTIWYVHESESLT
jgi:hypothetical protein